MTTSTRAATTPAVLVLEDGRSFRGRGYGALGETFGEAVFSTGMTGYQETLTDPSYHRQVVVMTAPHVGNTGVNDEDPESSRIWVAGYVVRDPARVPAGDSLGDGARRRRRVVDDDRPLAEAWARLLEDVVDGGIVRQRQVHPHRAPYGLGGAAEGARTGAIIA